MKKIKDYIKAKSAIIYAIVWSVGLFFSTFLSLLFDNSTKWLQGDVSMTIILPCALVVALYLWEEAYNISKSIQPKAVLIDLFVVTFIVLGMSILLIALVGVLENAWRCVAGALGWICISIIKYLNIKFNNHTININSH